MIVAAKVLMVGLIALLLLLATQRLPLRTSLFLLAWLAGPIGVAYTLDVLRSAGSVMVPRYTAGSSFAWFILLAAGC